MFDATVWRLIAHHENRDGALRWSLKNERIAIGWGRIGNIKTQAFESPEDIRDAIRHFYPELSNSSSGGFSLWNFYSMMKNRDLVILRGDKSHCVVEVMGDYFFDRQNIHFADGNYYHQRPARLTRYDPDVLWEDGARRRLDLSHPRSLPAHHSR